MSAFPPNLYTINDRFSVGPHPCRAGQQSAAVHAFWRVQPPTVVCDLTCADEGHGSYAALLGACSPQAQRLTFPIPDMDVPTREQLNAILDALDAALAAHAPIYLHCAAGIGRSGLVVTAWHMRHGMSVSAALARVRTLRAATPNPDAVPESAAQQAFLAQWAEV